MAGDEKKRVKKKDKSSVCVLQDHPPSAHRTSLTTLISVSVLITKTKRKSLCANPRSASRG